MDMKKKSWTDAPPGPCRRAARSGAGRMYKLASVATTLPERLDSGSHRGGAEAKSPAQDLLSTPRQPWQIPSPLLTTLRQSSSQPQGTR